VNVRPILTALVLGAVAAIATPELALAGVVSDTVSSGAGGLRGFFSGCSGIECTISMVRFITERAKLLINIFALFAIIQGGIRLLVREEEGQITKAKQTIAITITAVFLVHLSPRILEMIYGAEGEVFSTPGGAVQGVTVLADEVYGLIRWAEVMVAVAAVITIIVSGLMAVATFGSDEGLTNIKRTIYGVIAGILLLITRQVIKSLFGLGDFGLPGNPTTLLLLARGVQIINTLLTFAFLVTVGIVVYAGIMMILNLGKEEVFNNAKNLIFRALIGLFVIFVSYVIIKFVIEVVLV